MMMMMRVEGLMKEMQMLMMKVSQRVRVRKQT